MMILGSRPQKYGHCAIWISSVTRSGFGTASLMLYKVLPHTCNIWSTSNIHADVTQLKNVFQAYKVGSAEDVEKKLALIPSSYARCLLESLALLSLQDQRLDVLKLCLDRGFQYQYYFVDAANDYEEEKPDSEIARILQASDFRREWPWPERSSSQETDPAEAFDEGGSYPVNW
jgi:hypothetical protein